MKTKNKSYYVRKLDAVFSEYVRRSHADWKGYAQCYTCLQPKPWKEMDNGHFHSRAKMSVRWDKDNNRPQCKGCNGPRGGEIAFYASRLLKELGRKKFNALEERARSMRQWTIPELKAEIEKYQEKLKTL